MSYENQTTLLQAYGDFVENIFKQIKVTQFPIIEEVGIKIIQQLTLGKKFWMYGSGHSHILCEEMIEKAGGYGFVKTTCLEEVLGNPSKCGILEREFEFASAILPFFDAQEGDVVYLISNSGTNGVIVELAKEFKSRGCIIVAHNNMTQSRKVSARHPSGKKLYEFADLIIDNCGKDGDAAFEVVEGQNMGATSNMVGSFIMQALNVVFTALFEQYDANESELTNGVLKTKLELSAIKKSFIKLQLERFYDYFMDHFNLIRQTQYPQIITASNLIGDVILADKASYMFGMGHDHSLVEEIHARAGTIMVNKSLVMGAAELMIFNGLKKSNAYANCAKYADAILAQCDPEPNEGFLLISQSFSEPALKRMLTLLKDKKCKVVVLVNQKLALSDPECNFTMADAIMDNCCDAEDAGFRINQRLTGALSTPLSAFVLQSYVLSMGYYVTAHGMKLPARISVNTDRGLQFTEGLNINHFKKMIV